MWWRLQTWTASSCRWSSASSRGCGAALAPWCSTTGGAAAGTCRSSPPTTSRRPGPALTPSPPLPPRVIAVSYEARAFGVARGMWAADARKLCPDLLVARVPQARGKADLTR